MLRQYDIYKKNHIYHKSDSNAFFAGGAAR